MTETIQQTKGNNCSFHDDCIISSLQCSEGICSCVYFNGFEGENCTSPSNITVFALAATVVQIVLLSITFYIIIRMIQCYLLRKIFSCCRRKDTRIHVDFGLRSSYNNPDYINKKTVKLHAKDYSMLCLALHEISTLALMGGRIFTLTFNRDRKIEESLECYALPLVFLSINLTQLQMGLAWLEAALKCNQLGHITKHLKILKISVNPFCSFLVIISFILGLRNQLNLSIALYQVILIIGAGIMLFGGSYLFQTMMSAGASGQIVVEGKAIRRALFGMISSLFAFEVALVVFLATKYSNAWGFNLVCMFMGTTMTCYQLSVLVYLDPSGKVLRFARRKNTTVKVKGKVLVGTSLRLERSEKYVSKENF